MDNGPLLLEIISDLPTSLRELSKNRDKDLQASRGLSGLHKLFHHVDTGENDALARPRPMGKEAMFNRVIL